MFFLTSPTDFQYRNEKKNLLSHRGAFFHLKFLEKVALVGCNAFGTFGAENLKEHLKIHPALYILIKSQISVGSGIRCGVRACAAEV